MKYTAYASRSQTDVLFAPVGGSAEYTGILADAIGWVEQAELMDPALWALFVEQFRIGNADDSNLGWRNEFWGKMMRGACFTYSYTQNEELYRILERTVRDLLTTQDVFGRIATYSVTNEFHGWDLWGRKYVMLGLQYFLEICRDDGLADSVVDALKKHADYICAKIGNDEIGKMPVTNTSEWWNGLNSSSILEPFVRLYELTGEQRYLDFSKKIIDCGGTRGFNIFDAALEGKLYPYEYPVTKAYEMISNFEGVLEYYRVTGEKKYRTMALNFARLVIESDITVIGCAGTTHELFDHSRIHQFDPSYTGIMQETCVTVTWMKFCWQLLCLTGDPKYADQIEISVYNALLGSINVNGKSCSNTEVVCRHQVFPFDSYSPLLNGCRGRSVGGQMDVVRNRFWWGCCVAIGSAGTGLIGMTAVMPAKNGAAVNLYLPGSARVALADGGEVTLNLQTDYPKEGRICITVDSEAEHAFELLLRIPAWSTASSLSVNGEPCRVSAGSYAALNRVWKKGDRVELQLDLSVRIIRAAQMDPNADENSVCHAALQRGPVMLARDSQLGENVAEAVSLTEQNGCAAVEAAGPAPFACRQHYRVKTAEGSIGVVDYASCGQNWNPDMPVTVWITTKQEEKR